MRAADLLLLADTVNQSDSRLIDSTPGGPLLWTRKRRECVTPCLSMLCGDKSADECQVDRLTLGFRDSRASPSKSLSEQLSSR